MDVRRMRWADRWIGWPACAGLTLAHRLKESLRPGRARTAPVRRVLLIKLAEQGAMILAWPAIRRAIEMVGRDNVYFLVLRENRFILDALEVLPQENIIAIPSDGLGATLAGALWAVRQVREIGIDAVVDLEFFARASAILGYLSGADRRVGFHPFGGEAPYRGDLLTHRISFNPHLHTAETFRLLVEALALPPDDLPAIDLSLSPVEDKPPTFEPRASELEQVRRMLGDAGADEGGPLILLNANCSDLLPLRRWPAQRYVELARRVLQRYPEVRVVLTGAPGEAGPAQRLVEQIDSPRCLSLAGRTTLRQLLVLYSLAEVLVTNDSGPAHFATLTPIEAITLFGPETPALFAARSPRSHILFSGIACSPCVSAYNNRRSPCRNNLCMQRISVDEVFAELCQVYESRLRTR